MLAQTCVLRALCCSSNFGTISSPLVHKQNLAMNWMRIHLGIKINEALSSQDSENKQNIICVLRMYFLWLNLCLLSKNMFLVVEFIVQRLIFLERPNFHEASYISDRGSFKPTMLCHTCWFSGVSRSDALHSFKSRNSRRPKLEKMQFLLRMS